MSSVRDADTYRWGAFSAKGARKIINEDAYAFFQLDWGKDGKTATAMIVADGISSTTGGGRASQIAVETIKMELSEPPNGSETTSDRMAEALAIANQEILLQARLNPQWRRMGTTVVLALIVDSRLYVMGLGDSRAYLVRKNRIHRLTTDHTWTQYTHAARALDKADDDMPTAGDASRPSPLMRYLGNPTGFHIDRGVLSPESNEKEEYISVRDGDIVFLCSDGLYKSISDRELYQEIERQGDEPEALVSSLISLAQDKGETDDITAVLLKLPEPFGASRLSRLSNEGAETGLPARSPLLSYVRFAIAALLVILLLAFQFGYRQPVDGGGTNGINAQSTVVVPTDANGGLTLTQTPTATATLAPPSSPDALNRTIPPPLTSAPSASVQPTVALPTPTSDSGSN